MERAVLPAQHAGIATSEPFVRRLRQVTTVGRGQEVHQVDAPHANSKTVQNRAKTLHKRCTGCPKGPSPHHHQIRPRTSVLDNPHNANRGASHALLPLPPPVTIPSPPAAQQRPPCPRKTRSVTLATHRRAIRSLAASFPICSPLPPSSCASGSALRQPWRAPRSASPTKASCPHSSTTTPSIPFNTSPSPPPPPPPPPPPSLPLRVFALASGATRASAPTRPPQTSPPRSSTAPPQSGRRPRETAAFSSSPRASSRSAGRRGDAMRVASLARWRRDWGGRRGSRCIAPRRISPRSSSRTTWRSTASPSPPHRHCWMTRMMLLARCCWP